MEDFINDLIEQATRSLRALANETAKRLTALWATITGFFGRVRDRWSEYRSRARAWLDAQVRLANSTATRLRWLLVTEIPRRLGALTLSIQAWTRERIDIAAKALGAALSTLDRWARSAVARIDKTVNDLIRTLGAGLASVRADVKRLTDHVFGVLASPQRLAAWAIGAILTAALDFLLSNAAAILRPLWAARATVAIEVAEDIEDIVTRIL